MKKGLLLIILVLGMLLVGCGKEKETEITSENVVSEIKNENIDIEKLIDEFYTNEKYSQKINGVTCFNPEYKELIFETFAKSSEQKSYSLTFIYKDENILKFYKQQVTVQQHPKKLIYSFFSSTFYIFIRQNFHVPFYFIIYFLFG